MLKPNFFKTTRHINNLDWRASILDIYRIYVYVDNAHNYLYYKKEKSPHWYDEINGISRIWEIFVKNKYAEDHFKKCPYIPSYEKYTETLYKHNPF